MVHLPIAIAPRFRTQYPVHVAAPPHRFDGLVERHSVLGSVQIRLPGLLVLHMQLPQRLLEVEGIRCSRYQQHSGNQRYEN
jgi:hypothetical protein